jgi:hypothetical protein
MVVGRTVGGEEDRMAAEFQLVIDCADAGLLALFWAAALRYELAPPPVGFDTWNDFYRQLGIPDEDRPADVDRITDPDSRGPAIWFHEVPEPKVVKNRLHLDIHASGNWKDPLETRTQRVNTEATRLEALGATITGPFEEALDHYAVGMKDPENNEFDIN